MHSDPGCNSGGRELALDPSSVREQVLSRVQALAGAERVSLKDAIGRVAAEACDALPAGRRIGAAELGLLAAGGRVELTVFRRPRVAVLCTGDELRPLGEPLAPGEIHDSNRYLLLGLLAGCGVQLVDRGRAPDRPMPLRRLLAEAAQQCDAVLTTGGVSAGDADLVCDALAAEGELLVRRVAMRPGRPMAFGRIGAAWIFSLAGKPAGVMSGFIGIVGDALRRLGGESVPAQRPRLPMTLAEPLGKRHGRTEYVQGIMYECDGRWLVRPSRIEGGRLCSMSAANCYIVLAPDQFEVAAGQTVLVQAFGDRA